MIYWEKFGDFLKTLDLVLLDQTQQKLLFIALPFTAPFLRALWAVASFFVLRASLLFFAWFSKTISSI